MALLSCMALIHSLRLMCLVRWHIGCVLIVWILIMLSVHIVIVVCIHIPVQLLLVRVWNCIRYLHPVTAAWIAVCIGVRSRYSQSVQFICTGPIVNILIHLMSLWFDLFVFMILHIFVSLSEFYPVTRTGIRLAIVSLFSVLLKLHIKFMLLFVVWLMIEVMFSSYAAIHKMSLSRLFELQTYS